jgi:hypothetical protein
LSNNVNLYWRGVGSFGQENCLGRGQRISMNSILSALFDEASTQ